MAKVLIVDDSPLLAKMYKKVVSAAGHQVEVATDGVEGLAKAKKFLPDLVLMDVMMPKLSGLKALAQLKADAATKGIKVVMLTNLANEEDAKKAKSMGALKYLLKEENDPKLVTELVKQVLGGGK